MLCAYYTPAIFQSSHAHGHQHSDREVTVSQHKWRVLIEQMWALDREQEGENQYLRASDSRVWREAHERIKNNDPADHVEQWWWWWRIVIKINNEHTERASINGKETFLCRCLTVALFNSILQEKTFILIMINSFPGRDWWPSFIRPWLWRLMEVSC